MGSQHNHKNQSGKNLRIAFFLNFGFTIFELVGGFYVNSVAIISDAIHDLGDCLSLGTAWYLDQKSKKTSNTKYSYGYARFSLLGALINSFVLIVSSIYITYEAVGRIIEPEHSDAKGMFFFALVGVAVNAYAAFKMSDGKSLNEKVISWHLMEDVLGWFSILVISVIIYFYDTHYLDPVFSLLITMYILWNVIKRLRETFILFLQGIPPKIDLVEIEQRLLKTDKVKSLHHTHIWSLEGEKHVFTTHVKLEDIGSFNEIIEIKNCLKEKLKRYQFKHLTIETELDQETCSLLEE